MKKAVAIILVLVMALSLFACSGEGNQATSGPSEATDSGADASTSSASSSNTPASSSASSSSSPPPSQGGSLTLEQMEEVTWSGRFGDDPLDKVGYFDPTYDYTANKRYVVLYMVHQTGVLYEGASAGFEHWANVMNCEYRGLWSAGGDHDLYVSSIQVFAAEVDGFILDPDFSIFPRVAEIVNELGKPWMSQMSKSRWGTSLSDPMNRPNVGGDNYVWGLQQVEKLLQGQERHDIDRRRACSRHAL